MSHYAALPKAVALALPITLGAWTVQAADIIETAEEVGRFNGFLHLLEAAGMVEVLEGEGPFTVFAPVDESFRQLPPGVLEWLLAEDLLGGAVEVATLGGGTLAIDGTTGAIVLAPIEATVTEVEGQAEQKSEAMPITAVVVEAPPDSVTAADHPAKRAEYELMGVAVVVEPDIEADNGVIHAIDLVLLPPEVQRSF